MKKKILVLGIILAVIMAIAVPMAVLAGNEAGQEAATSYVVTIQIRNQDDSDDITTIYFPEAAAGTTDVTPYNDVDGVGSPQAFSGTDSTPVALLTSGTDYTVHYTITDDSGWNETVVSEQCYVADSTTVDQTAFDTNAVTISSWGTPTTSTHQVKASPSNENGLYLSIDLESVAGKSGSSTLTILGES